jgi:amino acid transporter
MDKQARISVFAALLLILAWLLLGLRSAALLAVIFLVCYGILRLRKKKST